MASASFVRWLVHGIGKEMHEAPARSEFRGPKGAGMALRAGSRACHRTDDYRRAIMRWKTLDDGWTIVTADRKYARALRNTLSQSRPKAREF